MSTEPMTATQPIGAETQAQLPPIKPVKKKRLPDGIAANVKQHVVMVCDHSGSMAGQKIDELNAARQAFVQVLADPENRDGFLVTDVPFDDQARRGVFAESAIGLVLENLYSTGGTDFTAAIREALLALEDFSLRPNDEGWHHLRLVVVFASDGHSHADPALIDDLKEEATVIAIAYSSDADQAMLSRISSDGQVHVVGTNGDELRRFLAGVGKTISEVLQQAN